MSAAADNGEAPTVVLVHGAFAVPPRVRKADLADGVSTVGFQ
jgi:hypothetical protein